MMAAIGALSNQGKTSRFKPHASLSHERTFLQSLSEQERNALLRGAKIFFQKGADSSDGGSLDEHVRRLDSLREIIDVDLDFAKTAPNNSQPSPRSSANATPDTSLGVLERPLEPDSAMLESEKDLVHEVARLRVQGSALRAENDALRSHSQRLAQHVAEARTLHSDAMVENRNRQLKMAQESASTIAELEEQLARHRSALAELAAQAEGLANDNSLLATEVATLRDQKRLLEEQKTSVEERSRSVQALYLNNLEETRRTVTAHEARRERILDQIATKEVLALSQPPEEYPVPVGPPPADVAFMLQENANLRKRIEAQDGELKKLRGELGALTEAHDRLSDASRRERSGAQAHASKMQSRLIGAVRRLEYLTEADAAKAKKLEEKEKYIHKLETELVRHHKVVGALCNRVCALELARRAPHEVEDLDNETWMMGLPAGVSRQIATVLAAPRAESRPRRGSPQRSRKAPASVPASEEDASIRARAATERMQSHIMQLLHPALSVPTTPRSVESRDVDAAEERRGMRSDVEISFATEEGVPEPRAGAASESLDVSPVWRSAKNPGVDETPGLTPPRPRLRLDTSAHVSRAVSSETQRRAGDLVSPGLSAGAGQQPSPTMAGQEEGSQVVEALPAAPDVLSPAQTPGGAPRVGVPPSEPNAEGREEVVSPAMALSGPLQRLTDLDRRTGETIEQLDARLQSLLDASRWSSRDGSERHSGAETPGQSSGDSGPASGSERRPAGGGDSVGQSSGWEPQEEGRSGAQKGEGERGEGVLSQSTIDVSEILKRVQQGEELALADIDKLTSKLRAIRDDTMQRAGME